MSRCARSVRPLLGAHFSIAGGLHKALYTGEKYGCTAVQIFTKNASTWKERVLTDQDIEAFDLARQETGITAISSHTAYLINLGSPEKKKFDLSVNALICEMAPLPSAGHPLGRPPSGGAYGFRRSRGDGSGCRRHQSSVGRKRRWRAPVVARNLRRSGNNPGPYL